MDAYFDASCLVTLTIGDDHWALLTEWLVATAPEAMYSDFGLGESVAALGTRVRAGAINVDRARGGIAELGVRLAGWRSVTTEPGDIADATAMVAEFDLALRLPDTIHLAIARRIGATLVTTDRGQARAAAALGMA